MPRMLSQRRLVGDGPSADVEDEEEDKDEEKDGADDDGRPSPSSSTLSTAERPASRCKFIPTAFIVDDVNDSPKPM